MRLPKILILIFASATALVIASVIWTSVPPASPVLPVSPGTSSPTPSLTPHLSDLRESGSGHRSSAPAELPRSSQTDLNTLRAYMRELMSQDPLLAAFFVEGVTTPLTRDILRIELGLEWADQDLNSAILWVDGWPSEDARSIFVTEVGSWFVNANVEQVKDWLEQIESSGTRTEILDAFFSRSLDWDLNDALEIAFDLPEGPAKTRSLIHISGRWVQQDLSAAVAYAESLPPADNAFAVSLISQWTQVDPLSALTWAIDFEDPDTRERMVTSALAKWGADEPVAAADFASQLPAGPTQHQAVISVVSSWAAQNPQAAAEWVYSSQPENISLYMIENIAFQWPPTQLDALVNWLDRLEFPDQRDSALAASGTRFIEQDPDLALAWFSLIDSPDLQSTQIERAIQNWMAINPERARTWIYTSDLPIETKERLVRSEGHNTTNDNG